MTTSLPLRLLGFFVVPCILGACTSSPWSQTVEAPFAHSAEMLDAPVPATDVHVQHIPWQRMDTALHVFDDAIAASDVHATQWTYQEQLDLGGSLRTMLQLPDDMTLAPIAVTRFTSTRQLSGGNTLAAAASQVGADIAVWSRVDAGEADIIVREPITEYTTGSVKIEGTWETYTETSTAWVPVPSRVRQWKYAAMFLRTEPTIGTAFVDEPQ